MSGRIKGYGMFTGRGLLLAGYLFLFAGQFNYRYFTIANFYVYGNGNPGKAGVRAGQLHTANRTVKIAVAQKATGQRSIALHDNSQRPSHLGIDKRYRFKQGIRIPEIRAPGVVYAPVAKTRFQTLTPVCFSTDLPTISLRGPPCA